MGLRAAIPIAGVVAAGVWKLRHYIQGYWFDQRCPARCAQKDLTGRTALVTGATAGGLGCAIAEHLARRGARVIITCRSAGKAIKSAELVAAAAPAGAKAVSTLLVDFADRDSVRSAAAKYIADIGRLDILVLNAGIGTGPKDVLWQTNHVGPFMFTEILRPLLEKAAQDHGDARVVAVSSGAHKRASISSTPYDPPSGSYGQSKLAQIMHMRELQRRVRANSPSVPPQAFRCMAITPGFVGTNIFTEELAKYPSIVRMLAAIAVLILSRSPRMGAEVILMACLDDELGGGEYLSNCYVKPAEGKEGCANSANAWAQCWELTQLCAADGRF